MLRLGRRELAILGVLLAVVSGCSTEQESSGISVASGRPSSGSWSRPGRRTCRRWGPPRSVSPNVSRRCPPAVSKIKVYSAGELVPAFEVFDAVAGGTAEMGHGAAYYWPRQAADRGGVHHRAVGMNAQEMNGWLRFGGGMELWRELYEPFGVVPIATGNSGAQMAGWFNKEIRSLADIQGLKMRIPGLGGEVFSRAGGVAVSMPGSDMFTALQTASSTPPSGSVPTTISPSVCRRSPATTTTPAGMSRAPCWRRSSTGRRGSLCRTI